MISFNIPSLWVRFTLCAIFTFTKCCPSTASLSNSREYEKKKCVCLRILEFFCSVIFQFRWTFVSTNFYVMYFSLSVVECLCFYSPNEWQCVLIKNYLLDFLPPSLNRHSKLLHHSTDDALKTAPEGKFTAMARAKWKWDDNDVNTQQMKEGKREWRN